MDHLTTPWSLDVGRLVARWCQGPWRPTQLKTGLQRRACLCAPGHRPMWHCTPTHGSWLHQAEWFLGVRHRRLWARGSFGSAKEGAGRVEPCWHDYTARHAHPYRWTSTGELFVRDTPLSRTRRQQRHGRACGSQRPKQWARLCYPPRPYGRRAASLVMNVRNALLGDC